MLNNFCLKGFYPNYNLLCKVISKANSIILLNKTKHQLFVRANFTLKYFLAARFPLLRKQYNFDL